jgi:hypothetical protein
LNITPPAVLPFVSPPFEVRAKAGDQDGVCLPWFSHADATLLYGQADIHGQDMVSLSLRSRWTETGRFELWPDSKHWTNVTDEPLMVSPLLSLENYAYSTQTQLHAILPADKPSSSPSYTFVIRVVILKVLKPTSLALLDVLSVVGSIGASLWRLFCLAVQGATLYFAVVVLFWCIKGRPAFREFFATSPLTRFIHRRLVADTDLQSHNVESTENVGSIEPRIPLTGIGAFFRSSSPLDDLLFTFSSTRHLTQPLLHDDSSNESESIPSINKRAESDLEAGHQPEKGSGAS